MKKLYSMLFALLALGLVSSNIDARYREGRGCNRGACRTRCVKRCAAPCEPKTQCTEKKTRVWEPCEKVIRVKGVCPHEICERTCTTISKSKACVGPCQVSCPSAVDAENRGENLEGAMASEEESYGG